MRPRALPFAGLPVFPLLAPLCLILLLFFFAGSFTTVISLLLFVCRRGMAATKPGLKCWFGFPAASFLIYFFFFAPPPPPSSVWGLSPSPSSLVPRRACELGVSLAQLARCCGQRVLVNFHLRQIEEGTVPFPFLFSPKFLSRSLRVFGDCLLSSLSWLRRPHACIFFFFFFFRLRR